MGLVINFKTQRGEIYDRKFNRNEGVSIYGKATTLTGIINPATHIRIHITDENKQTIFYDEKNTDLFGDFDFWFRTPLRNSNLNVNVIASYPVSGQDETNIPVAVGERNPSPLPRPQTEFSILSYLPLLVIGLGTFFIVRALNE